MEAYKIKLINEYQELVKRSIKLEVMLDRWRDDELDFEPTCPVPLLESQLYVMKAYLSILEQRAEIEGIDLI